MKYLRWLAVVAVLGLAACGGGNDDGGQADSPPEETVVDGRGFWVGTASDGRGFDAFVVPGGDAWVVYTHPDGTPFAGVLQGKINGAMRDVPIAGGAVDFTSTVASVPGQSFEATMARASGPVTYGATYNPLYELRTTIEDVAGEYTSVLDVEGTLEIAADGALNGSAGQCLYTGTISPRTDANLFDVAITWDADTCESATAFTGVATFQAADARWMLAVTDTTKTFSFIFYGIRN